MNNKGFTLIEVVIVIVLVSLVLAVVTNLMADTLAASENTTYKLFKDNIVSASYNYVDECSNKIIDCDFRGFKTFDTYMVNFEFNDKFLTKFDEKTFFDKIPLRIKDKQEYEGIYAIYQNIGNKYKDNTKGKNSIKTEEYK